MCPTQTLTPAFVFTQLFLEIYRCLNQCQPDPEVKLGVGQRLFSSRLSCLYQSSLVAVTLFTVCADVKTMALGAACSKGCFVRYFAFFFFWLSPNCLSPHEPSLFFWQAENCWDVFCYKSWVFALSLTCGTLLAIDIWLWESLALLSREQQEAYSSSLHTYIHLFKMPGLLQDRQSPVLLLIVKEVKIHLWEQRAVLVKLTEEKHRNICA